MQNLTWKDETARRMSTPITYVPTDLDHLDIDYGWIIRSVIRHRDLEGVKPFKDWDRYPLTVGVHRAGLLPSNARCAAAPARP